MFGERILGYRSGWLDDVTEQISYYHVDCVPAEAAKDEYGVLPLWEGTEWDFEPRCAECHMPIIVDGLTEQALQGMGLIPLEA
jgi:hypothetical protein